MAEHTSPNALLQEAKEQMLKGADPVDRKDWMLILNFMSFNISAKVQPAALLLIKTIYNMPVSNDDVIKISEFQAKGDQNDRSNVLDMERARDNCRV